MLFFIMLLNFYEYSDNFVGSVEGIVSRRTSLAVQLLLLGALLAQWTGPRSWRGTAERRWAGRGDRPPRKQFSREGYVPFPASLPSRSRPVSWRTVFPDRLQALRGPEADPATPG